jgi:hypothetical protein
LLGNINNNVNGKHNRNPKSQSLQDGREIRPSDREILQNDRKMHQNDREVPS